MRKEMGTWTLRLSLGLGLLAALLINSCCAEDVNYCLLSKADTCTSCLRSGVGCAYCSDETFNQARCDLYENILAHGCSAAAIITVKSSRRIEQAERINVMLEHGQVTPQQASMTFLPGEEKMVDMEVFAPIKAPLDLYILMDFSNSMSDDLSNLKRMGKELATLVKSLSNNYTIGFGKFVDKVVEPQTDMRPVKIAQPWPNSDSPFSFKNAIKLTGNVDLFNKELQGEKISGNLDPPEGGFDAILQATVCKDQIGWRDHSTHLLVFSTESAFHYESDGANVLAGILPRNDEECHLDIKGSYTKDTQQDYPSVPTLVRQLRKHNIIPVFAVTNHSYTYYQKLHKYFPIAEVGLLQEDSSNILNIMQKAFQNIRSKMSIHAEDLPQAFKAQFLSSSGNVADHGAFQITPGQIGKFKVRLQAQKMVNKQHVCELNPDQKVGTMRVKPTTFSDALAIKAEVLCPRCDCEKTPSPKAARCNAHGDLVCGKCLCYDGWLGAFCNCSLSQLRGANLCLEPGAEEPCSGHGDCLCGTCVCFNPEQRDGPYCQYDKSQCPRYGGFICNDRGSCLLGQCACSPDWEGLTCECPKGNGTCVDSKGTLCNGRGECVCGQCVCHDSALPLNPTCEVNTAAQVSVCEGQKSCVQCQMWNTGEKKDKEKCDQCPFKVIKVDKLKESKQVIESCSYRDEEDDCTYYYTVDYPEDKANKQLEVQVLEKKECAPGGFLWLIPLIMFLMLLLALLLLCCWKYCRCCWEACLALLPCCGAGRYVGFKEDEYLLRQSLLTSDHLDTPMVRTGPPKGTDVVRWKVTDNVHRGPNHPGAQVQPSPKETIQFPVSLRLNKQYSENLSQPDSIDTELLRKEVNDNLNEVYKQIPGAQKVQKTSFRMQRNAGKRQDHAIVDSVLSAPRSSYPDIVQVTERNVQSGKFHDLRVMPGYYTVATDREASGAVEFQEGVESVDVHVPLFVKEEDDDKKQLRVEAVDVPLGIAKFKKRFVNITVIKEHAKSVFSFLQPSYAYSRQDGVAKIPISREIIEDGRTQVTYRTRDLTAKDKQDYLTLEGDLSYGPGETQKVVPVQLLELGEKASLLEDKQVKQFVMDLSNPRQGAKLGRYPRTTVTITDEPDPSVVMFKKATQNFTASDPSYTIPVVRTRNLDVPATAKWRTKNAHFDLSGPLKFGPGQNERNIVIDKGSLPPGPALRDPFQLELFDPSSNAVIGERKTTLVNIGDGVPKVDMGFMNQKASSPGGRLMSPLNAKAKSTSPKKILVSWDPPPGNPLGYKVMYWIYGDPEQEAQVVDVKNPQAELHGLYPYCDYEMRVCAYNTLGDGISTEVIPCQTLEDLPGEPGRLAFNVISSTVTQVSWAEPAETNGNITAYEVLYTPINEDMKPMGPAKLVKIDNPKRRMLLIENLQTAQTYQYEVRAKNSIGWGPYRDATINLASQPTRPLSIPIIPDIPIVDAEAGDEYDSFLMYSNEVLKSPSSSKTPSVSGEDWKHVKLVGSSMDLRNVSWKKNMVDVIPQRRLSSDADTSSDEAPPRARMLHPGSLTDQVMNGKWDQSFHYPGSSVSRNLSTSSSPMSTLSYRGAGGSMNTMESTSTSTTYMSGQGTRRQDMTIGGIGGMGGAGGVHTREVVMRKHSENRGYGDENIRDSIIIGDIGGRFPDLGGFGLVGTESSFQSQYSSSSYGFPQTSRARTESSEVNDALLNLDRVLQDSRVNPGVPETPTRLVFSALGPTALRVSWQEPHCERDILGYSVLYQLLNGGEVKRINISSPGENSVVVQDLLPNHSYLFKVKAQSQEGWGPEREGVITIESAVDPKSPLSPMPGSPFTLSTPSAPGPLVFTALSPEALQLSWEKPRKPNGDILGYVVTCEQLHGGGDVRSFQVSGDSAETSLTVPNLSENMPYKFKVQARTTQGFGPEREGIITIESQDGGTMSQYSGGSSMTRREVFQMPTEVSTHTNVSRTMFTEPYFSGDSMMTQQMGTSSMMTTGMVTTGMVTRQVTKEVVQKSLVGGTTVTKKVERFYES